MIDFVTNELGQVVVRESTQRDISWVVQIFKGQNLFYPSVGLDGDAILGKRLTLKNQRNIISTLQQIGFIDVKIKIIGGQLSIDGTYGN